MIGLAWILAADSGPDDLEKAIDQAVPSQLESSDWIMAGVVLVATVILARVAHKLVMRLADGEESDSYAVRVLARFVSTAIVIAGLVFVLASLEINLAPLLAGMGLIGFVIAFATRDITSNYVAGLLIGIRRPFRVGDEISSQGNEGLVEDLTFRYTTLRAFDNTRVMLPNAGVLGNPLTNFTVNDQRRSDITVQVAFDTDLEAAKELLQTAAGSCAKVLGQPAPVAKVTTMGDSAIEICLYFWHEPQKSTEREVRDQVVTASLLACRSEGITIPFPRREVEITDPEPGDTNPTDDSAP